MKKIVLSALLVTTLFSADVVKSKSNSEKKMMSEVVKTDKKEVERKEIRSKSKRYPRGNIATH